MKKRVFAALAVLMALMVVFVAGCEKTPAGSDSSAVSGEESAPGESDVSEPTDSEPTEPTELHFKTGTWATDDGQNYVFYEDGKGGKVINVAEGTGLGFEYELNADGTCVFHMGSIDDVTNTTVEFIDGGDMAAITFEEGDRIVIMFVSEDISDDFAYHYVMGQVTSK